jgi:hypothetical protein
MCQIIPFVLIAYLCTVLVPLALAATAACIFSGNSRSFDAWLSLLLQWSDELPKGDPRCAAGVCAARAWSEEQAPSISH